MNTAEKENNIRDFEKLRGCIGVTIKAMRIGLSKTLAEMSKCLRLPFGIQEANEKWVLDVEEGRREISFAEFENICKAFGIPTKEVLECALRAKESHFLA